MTLDTGWAHRNMLVRYAGALEQPGHWLARRVSIFGNKPSHIWAVAEMLCASSKVD